jgi:hypothetical protein
LNRLLPQCIDNTYRGYKVALWLFGLLVLLKTVISLRSIFDGYAVATTADGIPLDTYSPAAVRTIVSLWALLGLSSFMLCLLCILALIRYRSMVPLMFAIFLLEYLGRRLILHFLPIVTTGTPPGFYINLALLVVMIAGLALSLSGRRRVDA